VTYEQLDFIADSYIPLLFIVTSIAMVKGIADNGLSQMYGHITATLSSIVIAYGVMFLDIRFNIWPAFESDYSTHTALSLVFVSYFLLRSKVQMCIAVTSLIAYFILMVYQQYHTVTDIISTSLVLLPLFLLFQVKGQRVKYS
jgi:hypothetical protein